MHPIGRELPISAHVAPCWCTGHFFSSLMHPIGRELPISAHVAPCWCTRHFFSSLMHPIGCELPISAHVACARVCQQLDVLCASHALVQATVGVGTVILVYIGVAYTTTSSTTQCSTSVCRFPKKTMVPLRITCHPFQPVALTALATALLFQTPSAQLFSPVAATPAPRIAL